MNVFINNIPATLPEDELEQHIANILHGDLRVFVASGLPTNFKLKLFKFPRSGRPKGNGILSIAYKRMGQELVSRYGSLRLPHASYILRLGVAKEKIDAITEEELKATAYEPPHVRRARLGHAANLAVPVPTSRIDIGYLCRDGIFSIEWSKPTPYGQACFDAVANNLRVFTWPKGPHAVLQPNSAEVFVADEKTRTVFLFLSEAPSFEDAGGFDPSIGANIKDEEEHGDDPLRVKLAGLDDAHTAISTWISRCFRLSFSTQAHFIHFLLSCKEVGFILPAHFSIKCSYQLKLYSPSKVKLVRDWQKRLAAANDWPIAFQIDMLMSNGILYPEEILLLREPISEARLIHDDEGIVNSLRTIASIEERQRYQPPNKREPNIVDQIRKILIDRLTEAVQTFRMKRTKVEPNKVPLHQIKFTPTGRFLEGPTFEHSNRVLRKYEDHIDCSLRVKFAEEDQLLYRPNRDVDSRSFLHDRFGAILKAGFMAGGLHFDFLAYSNSALREHTVYFCRPFVSKEDGQLNAELIRTSLGDFTKVIHYPARYGARMSQAFSSTEKSITVEPHQTIRKPDISCEGNLFTDGCGSMSKSVARAIGRSLHSKYNKSAAELDNLKVCQMRIGGAKGMMSVDSTLEEHVVILRPSQEKFLAPDSLDIEICSTFTKPLPYFLNRPLIKILEDRNVNPQVFLDMQKREIDNARAAEDSVLVAASVFQMHGYGESFRLPYLLRRVEDFLHLTGQGLGANLADDFIASVISLGVKDVLKQLKHKARIPVELGQTLVGIADEYGIIPEGCIYARVEKHGEATRCLTGKLAVSRSPNLHPGDLQICKGLDDRDLLLVAQGLHYLANCIVFSVAGSRSLPSMLAGGDLDGDIYNILFDPDLMPTDTIEPAEYAASPIKQVPWACTINDVADFVIDFIENDCTGLVSTLHLQLADEGEEGTKSYECLVLAQYHSRSVDFQKSGIPVDSSLFPRPAEHRKPDFLSPEGATAKQLQNKFYPSARVLGALFRAVDLQQRHVGQRPGNYQRLSRFERHGSVIEQKPQIKSVVIDVQRAIKEHLDLANLKCEPTSGDRSDMRDLFDAYANELAAICANNSTSRRFDRALSEEEAFIGLITYSDAAVKRKRDAIASLREQTENVTECVLATVSERQDRWVERAYAAWSIGCDGGVMFGARSFSWLVLGSLIEAIKDRAGMPVDVE